MAVNYAAQFRTRRPVTPQSQPIPGSNQVQNNAGGFTWQITPWDRLERFLVLGAEGGTYYVGESDLIKQNHDGTLTCIKEDGVRAVKLITDISVAGRAYKNDPAVFALALAATHGSPEAKAAAYAAVPDVCRIGTHLFHFAAYTSAMRGWGRGLRRAIASWYTGKRPQQLAYQVIKYQQRDGWSHADLLRLAHAKAENAEMDAMFNYIVKGWKEMPVEAYDRAIKRKVKGQEVEAAYTAHPGRANLPVLIGAAEEAKTADEKRLVQLIVEHELPREAIPTEKLNSIKVWEALLHKMPLTAMIRNLGKMTELGLLKPLSDASRKVVETLGNETALRKARIHPLGVLIALKQYSVGHGLKGDLRWTPVQPVLDALSEAFYATFPNVTPIGKPVLLGLDVSGSMTGATVAGTTLTCAEGVAALSLVTANVEKDYHIMAFDQGIRELAVSPKMRLDTVLRRVSNINGGGTDCALPMLYAAQHKMKVGGFVVLTDNETWAGRVHPAQALRDYRSQFVEDAREVVVGMAATQFSIADPNDRYALDVVGFDANAPGVIADFIRGTPPKGSGDVETEG